MPLNRSIKPYQKHAMLTEYAQRFGPKVFIETGTFRGHTIKAMLISEHKFDRLYTIELTAGSAAHAQKRFASFPHIKCLHGDSGQLLPELLKEIKEPCLFWLDAHYVGTKHDKYILSAPIREELKCILEHPCAAQHVILIDDVWYFQDAVYQPTVPTVAEIEAIVRSYFPNWIFDVELQIIRTHRHGDDAKTG